MAIQDISSTSSDIFDGKLSGHAVPLDKGRAVGCCGAIDYDISDAKQWLVTGNEFLVSDPELRLAGSPEFVGGQFEGERENRDSHGGKRRPDFGLYLTKDLKAGDDKSFAFGAIFLIGSILIVLAAAIQDETAGRKKPRSPINYEQRDD
jgi:hypothetical protein